MRRVRNGHVSQMLTDGYLEYGNDKSIRENGKVVKTEFVVSGRLAFAYMNLREEDYDLFVGKTDLRSIKVRTYYDSSVETNKNQVSIEGVKYDIVKLDPDETHSYMYWFLERSETVNDNRPNSRSTNV